MGFRFQRRVNLTRGLGLNISKSGVSSSVRTRFGSIGTKGFSIRTGVPGLTYRSRYGRKSSDAGLIALVFVIFVAILPVLIQLVVATAQILWLIGVWTVRTLVIAPYKLISRRLSSHQASQPLLPQPKSTKQLPKPAEPER